MALNFPLKSPSQEMRCPELPSQTAISGYASLLRSLRSNVVGPHTRSCRFSWGVGLQVVDAQKLYRFTTQQACTGSRAHISFAAPMVGASSDNIGAQRLAEGGVPASGAGSAKGGLSHPSGEWLSNQRNSAQNNWNLTPINN